MTKVLTKNQVQSIQEFNQNVENFRNSMEPIIREKNAKMVYNTDQMGVNLELLPKRTLDIRGSHQILSNVQQEKSLTHSYSMQFLISIDGELIEPSLIISKEDHGRFGPGVLSTMFRSNELFQCASNSGKLNKGIMAEWFKTVFFSKTHSGSVLVLDSLSMHRDDNTINKVKPQGFQYTKITIPPGLTGQVQPLDVGFNRSYKASIRRLSLDINRNRPNVKLDLRDTFFKLNAFLCFQFRSARFRDFIKHAWKKSGLWLQNINEFEYDHYPDPIHFCFDKHTLQTCKCSYCQNSCVVKCAWCKRLLCFNHYFFPQENKIHYCNEYVE